MATPARRDLALHDALWCAEHMLGGERYRRVFGAVDRHVRRRVAEVLHRGGTGSVSEIRRREGLDVHAFQREHVAPSTPVVLAGAALDWACVNQWTPEALADRYGDDSVLLIAAGTEDRGTGARQEQGGNRISLAEQIARMRRGSSEYARFSPLLHDHPELQQDFDRDWLRGMAGRLKGSEAFQLFMGGAATNTALHAAAGSNLFVQVAGRKRWWIASPRFSVALSPPRNGAPYFHSDIDVTRPDLATHPLFQHVDLWTCEIGAGDVLYVPPLHWHQVRNETLSIGVGYRWYSPGPLLRASPVMLLLTLCATNPPLWVARRHRRDFSKVFGELSRWT